MRVHPLLLALACAAALPACEHAHTANREEVFNRWKMRCYELSQIYKERLKTAPYHMIADDGADRCSTPDPAFPWEADAENMHILVANLFYHYDMKIRRQALELLEHYHCERDFTCGELADLLDRHTTATYQTQLPEWKTELQQRVRDFWRHLAEDMK